MNATVVCYYHWEREKRKFGESFSRIMARRGGLSQQQILAALNDIPEDVSEYEDDDDLDSDDYLQN